MLSHDHILQADHVVGCPACESIDPVHMTTEYAILQNYLLAKGW